MAQTYPFLQKNHFQILDSSANLLGQSPDPFHPSLTGTCLHTWQTKRQTDREKEGNYGSFTRLLFTTLCTINQTNMTHFRFKANFAKKHLVTQLLSNSIKHHKGAATPLPVLVLLTAVWFLLPAMTLLAWKYTLFLPSASFADLKQSPCKCSFSASVRQMTDFLSWW